MARAKASDSPIYQLRIDLRDIRPPIWRRILVRGDATLHRLHEIIQVLFDWAGYHLHMFDVGGVEFTDDRESQQEFEMRDEGRVRLDALGLREGVSFLYTYDFGDNWEHLIKVEKVLPPDPAGAYPVCLKGKRAGPPEDCGGPWGFEAIVDVFKAVAAGELALPSEDDELEAEAAEYDERLELLEWVGEDYNPEAFDLDAINTALRNFQK